MTDIKDQADIGLIGLGVMGRNLVLNMDDHGYRVAVFNRTTERVDEFLAGEAAGTKVIGTHSLEDLVASLGRPRKILLMITAGKPVEDQINTLFPMLDRGAIIMDGGNSLYSDTERRVAELAEHGIHYVGMGISGGEEGARYRTIDHAGGLRGRLAPDQGSPPGHSSRSRGRAVRGLGRQGRRRAFRQDDPQRDRVRRHASHRRRLRRHETGPSG